MIKLKSINKTYQTKDSPKVEALKDITLEFPSNGLITILGASGSGKTTLMNILGGLDIPTLGEIKIFDNDIIIQNNKKETLKRIEEYKRNYVSFIFQDYNLMPELNIEENLSLGFTFSSDNKTEQINKTLESVGLSNYNKRYPNELSGGEQQRIAIARGILKNSKMLLADEPTGNLDKSNSIEIMKILKEISKEKLVVVVSHNEELVTKYADGIVKLEDGKVIENTVKPDMVDEHYQGNIKSCIQNKIALKMAIHNFSLRKLRLLIYLLMMVITYATLSLSLSFVQYNHVDPHYNIIKDRNYEVFNMHNIDIYGLEYLQKQDGIKYVSAPYAISKQQLLDMGFQFYDEEIEFKEGCIYISEACLKMMFEANSEVIIDGEKVNLNYDDYEFTDLIGKELHKEGIISGIYRVPNDGKREMDIGLDYDKYYINGLYGKDIIKYNEHNSGSYNNNSFLYEVTINDSNIAIDRPGYNVPSSSVYIIKNNAYEEYIDEGAKTDHGITSNLSDNEVYISLGMYNKLFKTVYTPSYFIEKTINYDENGNFHDSYNCIRTLDNFDEKFSFKVTNNIQNKFIKYKDLVIKGIIISCDDYYSTSDSLEESIVFSSPIRQIISIYTTLSNIWIKTDSVNNLYKLMRTMYDEYEIEFYTPVTRMLNKYETHVETLQFVCSIFLVVLLAIAILLTISLISYQVYDRRKEIGILKSMGATAKEIKKIYLFEMLILIVPIIIISIVVTIILVRYTNLVMVIAYNPDYKLVYYKLSNFLYFVFAAFLLNMFATFIPLRKINKLASIEAIRR